MTISFQFIASAVIAAFLAFLLFRFLKQKDIKDGVDPAGQAGIVLDYDDSFNIAGINKQGLTKSDCGRFHGYVLHEKDNPYDSNAIAVYKGTSKQVGYLSKEIAASNVEYIDSSGGKVPCKMEIRSEYDTEKRKRYLTGRVQILWPTD